MLSLDDQRGLTTTNGGLLIGCVNPMRLVSFLLELRGNQLALGFEPVLQIAPVLTAPHPIAIVRSTGHQVRID